MKRLLVAGVVVLGLLCGAAHVDAAQRNYIVTAAASPIVIDGRLDEAAWEQATVVPLQYEYFPGDNTPAPVETVCLVTFDRSRLYVGCRASDPAPAALRANLADRDVPLEDDAIGFMVDPFNDGRRAFQFRVNARGVQMDAMNSDVGSTEDWSWDGIWDAKTQITATGYTVEVAVPFSSLRFPRQSGVQTWGFTAMRDMPRSTRYRLRSALVDRNRSCLVCQLDTLTGFTGIAPGRSLEFDPTVTLARTDQRAPLPPGGPLVAGSLDARAGLSARWSVTPNVIVSGTINPDFYQVEADAAQLDVNTQFQLQFPEKRPFFLEGADLFQTPLEAVFTRTIANPHGGVKLTGKQGANAFGVFVARDSVTGVLVPGFDGSSFAALDDDNVTTVLRYRRDLGASGSTVGVLFTGREAGDYSNHVAGADGLVRPSKADSIRFQWLGSQTAYPAALAAAYRQRQGPFGGQALTASYAHDTRSWSWYANASGVSPGFRADSGFMPQVGTRQGAAGINRTFIGRAGSWFNQLTLGAGCDRTDDWRGGRTSWGCDDIVDYSGPMQTSFSYNAAPNHEYYRGATYQNLRHNVSWSIRPNGAFAPFVDISEGGTIDFTNSRQAHQLRYDVGSSYSLFGRLTGRATYTEQALDVDGGRRLFIARLTQLQAVHHVTGRAFVRLVLQYTDVTRNLAAYVAPTEPRTRRLSSQFLFSYKVNPQTVFLAGYSDDAENRDLVDLVRSDRTFFLKFGYALLQ